MVCCTKFCPKRLVPFVPELMEFFLKNRSRYVHLLIGTILSLDFLKETWWYIMVEEWMVHCELKQTCGIECCMSRSERAQRNHICIAALTWIYSFKKRLVELTSFYRQQWLVIKSSITANISTYFSSIPISRKS
ncbi:MAG: hypothetical protein EB000_00075 [Alphaproteobacteria bacterium]|nr:hypothetical protein [Alphaproteobacteria bacterium]